MSITRMREKFQHVFKPVLILIALIFFVSIFFMYNSLNFGGGSSKEGTASIATVNGSKIDTDEFDRRFAENVRQAEMQRGSLSPLEQAQVRSQVLSQMIQERIQVSAAEKEGIEVNKREIISTRNKKVDEDVQRQKEMAFGQSREPEKGKKKKKISDAEFRELLKSQDMSLEQLREQLSKQYPDQFMHDQLMIQKLEAKVRAGIGKIDNKRLENACREVKMAQIVIASGPGGLPDAQAKQKAESIMKELKTGADFAKLARQHSADPAAKNASENFNSIFGDKDLENVKVGETSGVLKNYQGYRIVKILDSRLPKDFEKNKKDLREQYQMMASYRTLGEIFQKAEESVEIKWESPAYEGFYLADKAMYMTPDKEADRAKMMTDAVAKLEKARATDFRNADVSCKLAEIYFQDKQYTKAINILVDLMDTRRVVDHPQLRLMLTQCYILNKQNDKAVEELKEIAENSANPQIHQYVQMMYTQAGRADLAEAEGKWIKEREQAMTPPAPTTPVKPEAKPSPKSDQ
jgi:hypothetical protein